VWLCGCDKVSIKEHRLVWNAVSNWVKQLQKPTECYVKLTAARFWVKQLLTNGTNISSEAELQLTMMRCWSDLKFWKTILCQSKSHQLTVWEASKQTGISTGSHHTILTEDLGMYRGVSKICAKALDWIPENSMHLNFLRTPATSKWWWIPF
jgi:hypothetical protein